jgi:hypothetical protein
MERTAGCHLKPSFEQRSDGGNLRFGIGLGATVISAARSALCVSCAFAIKITESPRNGVEPMRKLG